MTNLTEMTIGHCRYAALATLSVIGIGVFSDSACALDISRITPMEAATTLQGYEHSGLNRIEDVERFVREAFAARRLDVLTACIESHTTGIDVFWDDLQKLPISQFKSEFLIMLLKSSFVVRYEAEIGNWMLIERGRQDLVDRLIPMVREIVPDTPIDFAVIANKAKRDVLANRMEIALGMPAFKPEDARRVWPPVKSLGTLTPSQEDGKATGSLTVAGERSDKRRFPGGWPLWCGIGALFAAVTGGLVLRRKRRGGKS